MSEFNKWQEYKALSDSEFYIAKEAWDHQQAKTNDSENTRAVLYRENMDLREKNTNLQAKIDALEVQLKGAEERAKLALDHKNKMVDELQEQLRIEREQGTDYFTDFHNAIAQRDELQSRVDEALIEMKNQLGDEDFCDMQRPDYDAMLYALRNIKDILKGNKDEN